ncbi:proline--tRNA ligase [Ureibacillus composti]|nr:proline--tRNA ligase [Ureibacillus composti]
MKQSLTFIPTMREIPSEAEVKSHVMLLRAGFIRQSTNGVYSYLPLAKRVLRKIENIIREELEGINAVEIALPSIQSANSLEQSGRLTSYGPEVIRMHDRHNRELLLAPTNEEAVTELVKDEIQSYKKLPFTLYQIQTKYRDEQKTRFGLLRSREFILNDTYSFHSNEESLNETYEQMFKVYSNILTKLGLQFRAVSAEKGELESHEFIVLSDIGEHTFAYSNHSDYAASIETAKVITEYVSSEEPMEDLEIVATPNEKTIEEVSQFFEMPTVNCIKSLVFKVDEELYVVLVRGDHTVNETKLMQVLNAKSVELADEASIQELLGCSPGSIGPIKLPLNVKVVADHAIKTIRNGIAGANEDGYHYKNVNPERDFAINIYDDIRYIQEGEPSPDGQGEISFAKGIEVAHIFKHGAKFSSNLNATFIDEQGKAQPFIMGSYNLGVSRLLAVIAEQYQDENGFVWPKQLAPYDIHLMCVNRDDEVQFELAEELYGILTFYQYNVLYDDRSERAGVKFADSDLLGLPVRVTIGKKAVDRMVEVKVRSTGETFECAKEEIGERLNEFFRSN